MLNSTLQRAAHTAKRLMTFIISQGHFSATIHSANIYKNVKESEQQLATTLLCLAFHLVFSAFFFFWSFYCTLWCFDLRCIVYDLLIEQAGRGL